MAKISRCPRCKTEFNPEDPAHHPTRPFCSARCQLADLHGWFREEYVVSRPIQEEDFEEGLVHETDIEPTEQTDKNLFRPGNQAAD